MAGIGFILRKLVKKDDLMGIFQAYLHSAIASSGPWLFTVIALGSFFLIFQTWHPISSVENFRVIIFYNFSFSLVLAAPFSIVATRYLADSIYRKQVDDTVGLMIGTFITLFCLGLPFISAFYIFIAHMSWLEIAMSVLNFMILLGIWLLTTFISAIKYYKAVTLSFILGLIISVICSIYFGILFSISGMLLGFNIGLGCIVASLVALVLAEYPKKLKSLFRFLLYIKVYWQIALGGLFYNLAIWVDKWIMWLSPDAQVLSNHLVIFPYYDEAMFLAYLTVIPGMALFLLTQETAFFEVYVKFYDNIQKHATLKQINSNHQAMVDCIFQNGRQLVLLQFSICCVCLLLAPQIFNLLGTNFIKLGIFRYGVLGSMFQLLTMYIAIILSYFDYRKGVISIQFLFFITNSLFTFLSIRMGFSYYGYGYFISTLFFC